jgi:hypothetical protein
MQINIGASLLLAICITILMGVSFITGCIYLPLGIVISLTKMKRPLWFQIASVLAAPSFWLYNKTMEMHQLSGSEPAKGASDESRTN